MNKKGNVQTKPLRELFGDKQTRMRRVTTKRAYTIFGWLNSISVLFKNKVLIVFNISKFYYIFKSVLLCEPK